MSRFVLSNEALIELDDIWEYIARDNIEAASRWIGKLLDACEMLAENPHAGHSMPEIANRSALFWPVGKYIIVYRPLRDHIEILAVTQGSRDIPTYLRKRP